MSKKGDSFYRPLYGPKLGKPSMGCLFPLTILSPVIAVMGIAMNYLLQPTSAEMAGDPIGEDQLDTLEEGDRVWLDVELVGAASADAEPWFEDYAYGCLMYWVDTGDDSIAWYTDEYVAPVLSVRVGDQALQAQLEGCPSGDHSTGDHENERYIYHGYRPGQRLSLLGEVVQQEPLLVAVDEHRGGSAEEHKGNPELWRAISVGVLCTGSLVFLAGFWVVLTGIFWRKDWGKFAQENSLQFSKNGWRGLGRIHGRLGDREVEMARRRGLGDSDFVPTDLVLRIELQPFMKAYEMRGQAKLERLGVLGGEEQLDDGELDPLFVFRGVDRVRWKVLLGDPQVKQILLGLRSDQVQIDLDAGWMVLHWPDLSTRIIDHVLTHAIRLADRMEELEGQGWTHAAEAIGLAFEIDEEACWRIRSTPPMAWELRYLDAEGWQTRFDLRFSASVPSRWRISAQGAGSDQRSGDPVLDDQLDFQGFEEGELEALIARPDATEILLASIRGHGLVIEEQQLCLRHPGLVAEPLELLQDAIRLSRLLEGAEPVPGEVDRIGDNER